MLHQFPLTFSATLVSILFVFWTAFKVGRERHKHGIQPPAMTGHPAFERAYRVQMNTVEQFVMFLPLLWLFAFSYGDYTAGMIGLIWPLGRALYAYRYYTNPEKRSWGFMLSLLSTVVLFLGCVVSLVMSVKYLWSV